MIKTSKILLLVTLLLCTVKYALADRGGVSKKNKSRVTLNITSPSILRNSIYLNLKSGLRYTGSLSTTQTTQLSTSNSLFNNSVITYQKGNTVYIIPYKQKIIMPEIKPGYTGMKLIIRQP